MSRDLDAQVAEKVMGFSILIADKPMLGFIGQGDPYWLDAYKQPRMTPFYSTDIKAAFEVVEKLGKDGWIVTLHRDFNWYCDLAWLTEDDTTWTSADAADTLPEAICLAALKAVGEETAE